MKTIFSIILSFTTIILMGQSADRNVISAAGSYTESGGLALSSTVGEAVISTVSQADIILTQGFQQPDQVDTTNVGIERVIDDLNISAFPNPTSDKVILELNAQKEAELRIELFNVNGKRLNNNSPNQVTVLGRTIHEIDMQQYAAGHYFIRLSDESGDYSESIKIQKVAQ